HLGARGPRNQLHAAGDDAALGKLLKQGGVRSRLGKADESRALRRHVQLCLAAVLITTGSLDFEDHLRLGVDLLSRLDDPGTSAGVGFVVEGGGEARIPLDEYAMTRSDKLWNDLRNERDTFLAARDFSGDADQ